MEQKPRLGRGLDALLPGSEDQADHPTSKTSISSIDQNPHQPRKTFDEEEIDALGESIKNHGVLQPLVVRKIGDRYQLIAGERRLRAAQKVGLQEVPVTVVNFNDQQVLEAALVENIQRTDLNPIEKAQGFKDYLSRFKMTHEQLAKRLGMARPTITNLLSLLDLAPEIQEMIRVGQLSTGHAKILKSVADKTQQTAFAREAITRGLSVHALDAHIKETMSEVPESEPRTSSSKPQKTAHIQGIEDELRQKLSARIEIKVKGNEKGQIVLAFESNDDFERLLSVLRKSA